MLTWAGFRAHTQGCLEYFTFNLREGGGSCVLLLHGVGCGLLPYFNLLITLASAGVGSCCVASYVDLCTYGYHAVLPNQDVHVCLMLRSVAPYSSNSHKHHQPTQPVQVYRFNIKKPSVKMHDS